MAKKVGLDYGHGRNTFPPSKGVYRNGKGYHEHNFNAKLGLKIKALLEASGIEVIEGQPAYSNDVHLTSRTNLYNAKDVDLVVSIHANAGNSNVEGRCVFYWHTSEDSKRAAKLVIDEIRKAGYSTHGNGLHASQRGSWTNLHICRETKSPAILVEHGFMTNKNDFELIFGSKQDKYINDMAHADAKAICKYLNVEFKDSITQVKPAPETQVKSESVNKSEDNNKPSSSKWTKVEGNWEGTPTLRNGHYGKPVGQLQEMLKDKGYLKSSQVDDYFGNVTENALKKAQEDAGIKKDGLAGKNTYKILNKVSHKANLKIDGVWGWAVTKALQAALDTPVDGKISRQPKNSVTEMILGVEYGQGGSPLVRALQKKVGSKADGDLGKNTIKKLQRYLGTPEDGVISDPSTMVKELQRRLNAGAF